MQNREFNKTNLKDFRKSLRKRLTSAEAELWIILKGNKLGYRFRRQFSVGNYVLDFYCPSKKLAVELDGEVHNDENVFNKDQRREIFLKSQGMRTIRFENKAVFISTEFVEQAIKEELDNNSSVTM